MRIFAFSDWRIQRTDVLLAAVRQHRPDVILYAGDDLERILQFGQHMLVQEGKAFWKLDRNLQVVGQNTASGIPPDVLWLTDLGLLRKDRPADLNIPLYYVNGNDDDLLQYENSWWIRRQAFADCNLYAEITVPPAFGYFELEKGGEKVSIWGASCTCALPSRIINPPTCRTDIVLSHLPPLGILDLSVRFGIQHVGSRDLRRAVWQRHPRLVVCGHSHFWGGRIGQLGKTRIINVSQSDALSDETRVNYAIIDTRKWAVDVHTMRGFDLRRVRGGSRLLKWLEDEDVLQDISAEQATKLLVGEISRFSAPEEIYRFLLGRRRYLSSAPAFHRVLKRLKSLCDGKPSIVRPISFDPDKQCYVDVETGLFKGTEPGRTWLIGLWHDERIHQFLLPHQRARFVHYIKSHDIRSMVSWTRYDHIAIRPILKKHRVNVSVIDACQRASNCCNWGTYGLEDLCRALLVGDTSVAPITGADAGIYADHLIIPKRRCSHCPPRGEIIKRVMKKNELDLLRLVAVCRKLRGGKLRQGSES